MPNYSDSLDPHPPGHLASTAGLVLDVGTTKAWDDQRMWDETLSREIARLRPLTKSSGLSIGDRAGLALARQLRLPVLTTDRTWRRLNLGVTVQTIR
jgi:PIN domain nuclease of toxin-antitoxin system